MATDAYAPSARLRALIVARDQTCRFPTCQVPAWRCQLDHIRAFTTALPAWAQTTETNLHALCTHHHQRKTSGALVPERETRTGATTWRTPTGHLHTRAPEPADYTALAAHLQHATQLVVCEPAPEPSIDPATLVWMPLAGEGSEPHADELLKQHLGKEGESRSPSAAASYGEPPF